MDGDSSANKSITLHNLSVFHAADIGSKEHFEVSAHNQTTEKSSEVTSEVSNVSSHGVGTEDIKKTGSFLLETAQGIQIFVASTKKRSNSLSIGSSKKLNGSSNISIDAFNPAPLIE